MGHGERFGEGPGAGRRPPVISSTTAAASVTIKGKLTKSMCGCST